MRNIIFAFIFIATCLLSTTCAEQSSYDNIFFTLEDGVLLDTGYVYGATNDTKTLDIAFTYSNGGNSANNLVHIRIDQYTGYYEPGSFVVTSSEQNVTRNNLIDPASIVYPLTTVKYNAYPYNFNFSATQGHTYHIIFFAGVPGGDASAKVTAWSSYGTCSSDCYSKGICINSVCQHCLDTWYGDSCQWNCPTKCSNQGVCIGNNMCQCNATFIGGDCACEKGGSFQNGVAVVDPQGYWIVDPNQFPGGAVFSLSSPVYGAAQSTFVFGSSKTCPTGPSNGDYLNMASLTVPACALSSDTQYVVSFELSRISNGQNITVNVTSPDITLAYKQAKALIPPYNVQYFIVDVPNDGDVHVSLRVQNSTANEMGCWYTLKVSKGHCPGYNGLSTDASANSNSDGCKTGLVYTYIKGGTKGRYYVSIQSGVPGSPYPADLLVSDTAPKGSDGVSTGAGGTTSTPSGKPSDGFMIAPFLFLIYLCLFAML